MTNPINEEEFRKSFKGEILTPNEPEYKKRLSRFWSETTVDENGAPRFIVCPKNNEDVSLAVRFSRHQENGREGCAIISGGHWVGRNSSKGVLIDMNRNLCSVQVVDDKRAKSGKAIRAGGGAVWAEIDRVGMQHGLATTSCDYAQTGAVGSGLTGGYGFLCGQHGLTVDNVLELEIVTANGKIEKVNEKDNSELFFACRGAAPALGCIVNVTLAAFKQESKVFLAALTYPRSKIQEVSDALRKWHQQCGEKEAVVLAIHQPRDAQEPCLTAHCFYNSNDPNVDNSLKKFEALVQAGPTKTEKGLKPYEEANKVLTKYVPHQQNESIRIAQAASLCTSTHDKNVEGIANAFHQMVQRNPEFRDSVILIDLFPTEARRNLGKDHAFGGRNDIHNANIIIQYQERSKDRETNEIARRLAELFEQLDQSPGHLEGAPRYAGYDSNLSGKEALGSNYERVRKAKGKYDPENVFNRWIKIEPSQA